MMVLFCQGSSRSGILGEATVSLGSYKNAETAVPVSLPLKKCNHGTILLVSCCGFFAISCLVISSCESKVDFIFNNNRVFNEIPVSLYKFW